MLGLCQHPERERCEWGYLGRRESNLHHLYFPKRLYRTPLEKAFRDLVCNTVQMCVCDHIGLHETTEAPKKPDISIMLAALFVGFEE